MDNHYGEIRFIAANYSKLQGLRAVPIGLFVIFVSVWAAHNQGPSVDLTLPITLFPVFILLYWLIGRYYVNAFGRIRQAAKTRIRETIVAILFGLFALLAFWVDTSRFFPFSAIGFVFAAALAEDFWMATRGTTSRAFSRCPESLLSALLILALSLLPLTGLVWWEKIGMPSLVLGMLLVVGILILFAGLLGHIRLIRALGHVKAVSNENTL